MRPIPGDPIHLRSAAGILQNQAQILANHGRAVTGVGDSTQQWWKGSASQSFAGAVVSHVRSADRAARVLRDVAGALRVYAGSLERLQGDEQRLRRRIDTTEVRLGDLRRDQYLRTDGDTPAQISVQITGAVSDLGSLRRDYEQVHADHRAAAARLNAALQRSDPPDALWRRGFDLGWMGFTYWTLGTKGAATKVLWQQRGLTEPFTPAQQAARDKALSAVQKGSITGFADKPWIAKIIENDGKGAKYVRWIGKLGAPVAMIDAAAPGIADVATGGGYSGLRGAATRYMGLVEIGGVVVSRVPGGQWIGGAAIVAWAAWKAGNKTHDNRDWWKQEAPVWLKDNMSSGTFGLSGIVLSQMKVRPGLRPQASVSPWVTRSMMPAPTPVPTTPPPGFRPFARPAPNPPLPLGPPDPSRPPVWDGPQRTSFKRPLNPAPPVWDGPKPGLFKIAGGGDHAR